MAYPDIATKKDLANELKNYAEVATNLEDVVRYTKAVLTAIYSGGLLDHLPADEDAIMGHNAGCTLLSELQRRLNAHEREDDRRPGTDLSIALRVMARDASAGRFAHRRILEEQLPSLAAQ